MTASEDRTWLVERVALDEAPPGTALTRSERRRLAELRADDDVIRAAYPKAEVAAEIRRRQRVERVASAEGRRRISMVLVPALAVTSAFVLFVRSEPSAPTDPRREPEVTRFKGSALLVHRKTPDGAIRLHTGDVAGAGDRIQLGLRLDHAVFTVLLSVDGRGVVSQHLPAEGRSEPVRLEPGAVTLPFSYELDDAPKFERFFLVTSKQAFSLELIRRAAHTLAAKESDIAVRAPLDLPPGLTQLDFVLMKGDSR